MSTAASPLGLYLHIPFCESICNYCNFNRGLYDGALKTRYVAALETEIWRAGDGAAADTIFFGGGTPSLLEPDEVRRLIDACGRSFDLPPDPEISFEANPETVTLERLRGWRQAGVNRLSFGVQSFDDDELRRLGRLHDADRARQAFAEARDAGLDNVSADVMLWLPAQTPADCRRSVEALVALAPDHASLYMLELYPNAPLREEMARGGWSLAPDDDAATMYLDALALTDAAGLAQYEISNVGRPCLHNLKYWRDGEWLGFGCGAHSTRDGRRWRNLAETGRYVEAVGGGEPVVAETRTLSAEERLGDALFTGLRLVEGIDLAGIETRYGVDVLVRFGDALEPFRAAGLLVAADGRLGLTRSGMLLANEVMGAFV
jgi:oxygen-independent coproporphyrinogen-3 oxidase